MKIKLFFIILFFSQSVFGGTGLATVYKITMTKIELCENATIINETSYTTSGCITVGTGNLTVDIASAAAGADIAKFADTTGLPIGKTYRWAQPTLSRTFSIKGSAVITKISDSSNAMCATNSSNSFGSREKYHTMIAGTIDGTPSEVTMYTPSQNSGETVLCFNADCSSASTGGNLSFDLPNTTSTYGHAIDVPGTSEDTFKMIYQLTTPYTVGKAAPKISILFGTSTGLEGKAVWTGSADACVLNPYFPAVNMSVSE